MSTVTVVKPETKVEIQQTISQQDVIELVAYKQIKKLEAKKTELSDSSEKVSEKLKDLEKKYSDSVIKEVTKLLAPFISVIKEPLDIIISYSCDGITLLVELKPKHLNGYNAKHTLDIDKLSTTKSKTHVELEEKKVALKKSILELSTEIQKIKSDKNSIKNSITEQLLMETEEGKSLMSLVENAYKDSFPKLLK